MSATEMLGAGGKTSYKIKQEKTVKPIKKRILGTLCEYGPRRSKSGILLLDDNGKEHGIRPRWFRVKAIGPDQEDVSIGDYILVEHGRWTWAIDVVDDKGNITEKIRMLDENGVIGISDGRPHELNLYDNPYKE